MASTAGVPSVTTSTLRSTPPWGPTGGAVGAAVNGTAAWWTAGFAAAAQAAASAVTAARAAASTTTVDRRPVRFPTTTPATCRLLISDSPTVQAAFTCLP